MRSQKAYKPKPHKKRTDSEREREREKGRERGFLGKRAGSASRRVFEWGAGITFGRVFELVDGQCRWASVWVWAMTLKLGRPSGRMSKCD